MKKTITRRNFISKSSILCAASLAPGLTLSGKSKEKTIRIDYHVHLTREFSIEKAVELSKSIDVKFGIVEHPGHNYAIRTDEQLEVYISTLRKYPVYIGLQPVYTNWAKDFSQNLIDQLDYILMDAETIPFDNGQYLRIWRHDNYIEDIDEFMDLYIKHIENILQNEQITIFGRPTYLPVNFARYYDQIWTEELMMKIIQPAKKNNIAMEISTSMHVPSKKFIELAKSNGLKFTFGTNARNNSAGKFHYADKMMKECKLTMDDMLVL